MKYFIKITSIIIILLVLVFNFTISTYAVEIMNKENNTTIQNETDNNIHNNENSEQVDEQNKTDDESVITDNTIVEEQPKEGENEVTKNNTTVKDNAIETTKEEVQNKTIETKEVKAGRTHQDGIYRIAVGKDSNKIIEVKGSNTENNAEVDIWDNCYAQAQKFYLEYQEEGYYKITAMHTGKALTVKDGTLEEHSEIVQADYAGLDSQKWVLRDTNVAGWVISLLSNPELSITVEGNIANGSKLVLGKTENNENQMFWIYNITTSEQYKANGTYKLAIGIDSNKALEIAGSSTENNAKVNLWKYGNKSSQKFKLEYINGYYKITVIHTGKALTVKDGVLEEGREIVQADYAELDSQKWILRDTNVAGWVISPLSNPQLSITVEGNIANGSRIILSKTKDNNNQMFWISNVSTEPIIKENGIYKIAMNKDSSKTVEVRGSNRENNAEVDIWNYGNVAAQKFYLTYEEGYYKITAMHTGKALTVKDGNLVEGAQIVQYDYQGLDSQKWILRDSSINGWVISLQSNPELSITVEGNVVNGSRLILGKTEDNDNQMMLLYNITVDEKVKENGIYKIAIGKDSSKTVEVKGSNRENNAEVDIWNYGNVAAQKFYLTYEEGYYKITAMHTGKALTVKEGKLEEGSEIVQYDYEGLDTQKWILRDTNINGWIISPIYNLNLSITVQGNIENGDKLVLSKTEDNEKQKLYLYNITEEERTHSDGIYKMAVGSKQNMVIEISGSNKENNAKVGIWDYYANAMAQKFYLTYEEGYYKITAMHTGKALTVKDGKLEESSEIVQYDYQGLDSQKWILRDTGINGWVISLLSNPELSITINGNISNENGLILSKTKDAINQMFCLYNITSEQRTHADKIYKITVGADPSKAMEVKGSSTDNNAIVDIWNYGDVPAQRFYLEYLEGFYKITAMHTGKALTVKDGNLVEGAQIVQYDYEGLDSQKWILRDTGINGWVISLLSNPNLSITVDGNIGNGSRLILSTTRDNNNQMFYISEYIDKNIKEGTYGQSGLMYKGTGGSYLKYYQIGKGSKHLFLNFAIHGFEDNYGYDGQELTYIADEFYNYLKDNMPNDLIEKWTVYIMPSSNPDGEYSGWTNNGPGRTTLYSWAPGNKGIDMNRCFSVGYKRETNNRNYNGTEPFQAYEAQALRDFILNNRGSQNIVIDVHGWLNETIGDNDIGWFYRKEFGISKHIGSYGSGYLVNWARSIGARSMLLELPPVYSHSQVVNNNYVGKFTNATMNLLRSF